VSQDKLQTLPLEELFMLIREGTKSTAYSAGEEIRRRLKAAQQVIAVDDEPRCLCPADGHSELCPIHRVNSSPR
jgi:hypothetical protein